MGEILQSHSEKHFRLKKRRFFIFRCWKPWKFCNWKEQWPIETCANGNWMSRKHATLKVNILNINCKNIAKNAAWRIPQKCNFALRFRLSANRNQDNQFFQFDCYKQDPVCSSIYTVSNSPTLFPEQTDIFSTYSLEQQPVDCGNDGLLMTLKVTANSHEST